MKLKYFLWLLLPLTIAILYFILPPALENYLQDAIAEKLNESEEVLIKYDEPDIVLYPLSISLKNLEINSVNNKNEELPDTLPQITAQFPEIKFSDISYWDYVWNKTFSIKSVSVESGEFQIEGLENTSPVDSLSGNLSVALQQVSIPKNDLKSFSLKSHKIIFSQITSKTSDGFYALNIKELKSEGSEKIDFLLKDFKLEPQFPRFEFSRKKGFQTDRSEVSIPKISFHQIHLDSILNHDFLKMEAVSIDSMDVKLFRDKNVPINPDRFVVLPQQIIREMPLKFTIDTIKLSNGFVSYEELIPNEPEPGRVFFDNLNAVSTVLSNDSHHRSNGQLDIQANGNLMGKGSVSADFHFNIFREDNQFNFSGIIGEMDLTEINPMVENVALVHIKSGKMNKMVFSVTANENLSIGNLNFYYHDLRASMLPPRTNENANFFKKILFDLMETLIVPKENLAGKKFRKGTINFKRDKQKSIVNYWWKSIFSGIKSTVGV